MSFWPFTNSFNNNTQLQKFLDGISDYSTINVNDLIDDANLSQELVNELHTIKGNYNNSDGFQFAQQLQQSHFNNSQFSNITFNDNSLLASDNDSNSITSSNDNNNGNSKDARGAKLVELLLQPQILVGFLDYLYKSVDFFHDLTEREEEELRMLLGETEQKEDDKESGSLGGNEEIEVEQQEQQDQKQDQEEDQKEDQQDDHADVSMNEDEDEEEDEDEDETPDERMRRCIQVSADVLSIEMWVISNRIIETPLVIDKLWSILYLDNLNESSPSVNHLVHILDQLMDTNSIELLNYIRNRDDLVDTFISKLEVPMLMDFFLRIIQSDKPDSPTGIIDTLYQQDLVPKLIDVLKPQLSQFENTNDTIPNHELFFRQTAATDFLKAVITISSNTALAVVVEANIGPNQLTRQLVSKEIINQIVHEIMLYTYENPKTKIHQTNKHGINNCVGLVIELIRKNNSDYDLNCGSYSSLLQTNGGETTEVNPYVMFQWLKDFEQNTPSVKDPIYLGEMLAIFSDNLDKFCDLMDLEPELPAKVDKKAGILGFTKFRISELIAELLHCSNMVLINSKKIRKIIEIRDIIRDKQSARLTKALSEPIKEITDDSDDNNVGEDNVGDVSNNIGDLSLDDDSVTSPISPVTPQTVQELLEGENKDFTKLIDSLDIEDESDDEEPTISPENPFVCPSRDQGIRANPCVGDYFKIKLLDSNILLNIISKFTEYPWHNFFHNVVFDLIQQIFNGKLNSYNSFLISNLFKDDKTNLTRIIVDTYGEDYDTRPGYLGHLILISEEVVKFTSLYKPDLISPLIVESITSDGWNWFVNEVLLKTREIYNVVLGAEPIDRDDDDDDDMDDSPHDQKDFVFDSATVGLGDTQDSKPRKSLIKDVVYEQDEDDEEAEKDDDHLMSTMSEVRIQDMSPKPEGMGTTNSFEDDDQDVGHFSQEGFLENLSESSSDDDDDDEYHPKNDDNKLTRVKNHIS